MTIWLLLFVAIEVAGALVFIDWLRNAGHPIDPRGNARYIFRLVHREDRAAYSRIMRRTYAVQMRDFQRALTKAGREIGKALLPPLRRLADELVGLLR